MLTDCTLIPVIVSVARAPRFFTSHVHTTPKATNGLAVRKVDIFCSKTIWGIAVMEESKKRKPGVEAEDGGGKKSKVNFPS